MAAYLSFNKIGKKVNNINLLADLSFGIQKGELVFILGKSNSGKSTLFKILMGFTKKDRGQIFVDGHHIGDCERIFFLDSSGDLDEKLGNN